MKRLSLLLLAFLLAVLPLISLPAAAVEDDDAGPHQNIMEGEVRFFDGTDVLVEIPTDEGDSVTAPPAPQGEGTFIGWFSHIEGNAPALVPAGGVWKYQCMETQFFTPLFISFVTKADEGLRVDEGDVGIRFLTELAKTDWAKLAAAATVERGTLIFPAEYGKGLATVTHDTLTAAGKRFLDVRGVEDFYGETETTHLFAGSVSHVKEQNSTRSYSAVGYMHLTYSDGTQKTVYASRMAEYSAWQSADAAYRVRTDAPAGNSHPFADGSYSPYSKEEIKAVEALLGRVIAFEADDTALGKKVFQKNIAPLLLMQYTLTAVTEQDALWGEYLPLVGVKKTGVLVVKAKDGTPLTADRSKAVFSTSTLRGIPFTGIFHEGAVLFPYSDYTDSY